MDEQPLKEITLNEGIYNLTPIIREYIVRDSKIPDEYLNILRTFNQYYDLERDIKNRGKEAVLEEYDKAISEFNFQDAQQAVQSGLIRTQTLNPKVKLKGFPIVFLFVPTSEDAKSLREQGCGININSICNLGLTKEQTFNRIESYVAHESTHVFLKQLGVKPLNKWTGLDNFICDFLWEEGLTTYMETEHYPHHERFINDSKFWIDILRTWIIIPRDDPKKTDMLNECINRESTQAWLKDIEFTINRIIPETDDIDRKFIFLITKMNGVAYHIGKLLWERHIKEGYNLAETVMQGSSNMKEWLRR